VRDFAPALSRMRASPAVPDRRWLGTSRASVSRLDGVDAAHGHDVGANAVPTQRSSNTVAIAFAWQRQPRVGSRGWSFPCRRGARPAPGGVKRPSAERGETAAAGVWVMAA
jgi:hypothetical protein